MLRCSTLARTALRGASKQDVAQVTRQFNQLSVYPQSTSVTPCSISNGSALTFIRGLATKTAKKPATKTAKKPAAKTARKPATKKKTTITTKKRVTKKKAIPAKKKPTPRRKVAKKAVKKPAAKRKVLSDRQKALLEKKKVRDVILALKAAALEEPKKKPETAWVVFSAEKTKGSPGKATDNMKAASSSFKSLTPAELEHYNHIANQNKAENVAAYTAWVSNYTPEQIRLANKARSSLKRKIPATKTGAKPSGRGLSPIKDDRQVKGISSAYLKFATDRRTSGDFKGISLGESAKLITEEWNGLSAGDKKKYSDLQAADQERYQREFSRTYGYAPASAAKKAAAAA